MRRRLLIWNLALMAGILAASWRLREDWIAARLREQATFGGRVNALKPPQLGPDVAPQPVTATGYAEIVEKMLFSKERNPTVVVEAAPAPPPKPMPKLPVLYGVMNLTDGITAVMSVKPGAQHQGVRPGDKIGEFTLVSVDSRDLTLLWQDKSVTASIDDLLDRSAPPANSGDSNTTPRTPAPTQSAADAKASIRAEAAPGTDVGNSFRACQPGDTSPAGTVSGGFRKVITQSPFGDMCRWVPI